MLNPFPPHPIHLPPFIEHAPQGTGSTELSFDIAITDASGNQLARKNNTQITFSR